MWQVPQRKQNINQTTSNDVASNTDVAKNTHMLLAGPEFTEFSML